MKYVFILFLSLLLAQSAFAAQKVKGNVPGVQPLQMPAVDVAPNVSHNVQYQGTPAQTAGNESNTGNNSISDNQTSAQGPSNAIGSAAPNNGHSNVWTIILIFLALGALAWFWLRQKSKKP